MKNTLAPLFLLCCFITTLYASENTTPVSINSTLNKEKIKTVTDDVRPKYRIGFDAPQINHRQLLLTIDENCTDGVDWGYEGAIPQVLADDMYWLIDNGKYVIQGTNALNVGKEVSLGVVTTSGGLITIKIDALEYPIDSLRVALKDTTLDVIHNLEESDYQVTLPAGEYHNRFFIVFLSSDTNDVPPPPPGDAETDTTETDATETDSSDASDVPPLPPGDSETDTETDSSETDSTDTDTVENDSAEADNTESESSETDTETEATENDTTDTDATEADTTETESSDTDKNSENSTEEDNNTYQNQFNNNKNKLVIYVNNGQRILNVKNKKGLNIQRIALFNRNGQRVKVWNKNLDKENIKFQLQVKRGVYIVMVKTDTGRVVKRVLIQKS